MPEEILIRVGLETEDLSAAEDVARSAGVDLRLEPAPQFFDPLSWVLIGGGVIMVGKFVTDWMDRTRGGVVIDMSTDDHPTIRRDKDLPYGWAVIVASDGKVKIEVHDAPKDAQERLLGAIISGAFKSAAAIAKAAQDALGAAKVHVLAG